MMAARVSLANLQYGTAVNAVGGLLGNVPQRHDIRLVGSLFSEYRLADWLGINGTLTYTGDFTDYSYALTNGVSAIVDPAKFNKFEAWLGLRAFY